MTASNKRRISELFSEAYGDIEYEPYPEDPQTPTEVPAAAGITRPNGEEYFPRLINGKVDVDVYRQCRKAEIPFILSGAPGCGKTAALEATFGDDLITVEGRGFMQESDLLGAYVPRPGGEYEWVDGPLVRAMKDGAVLLADDITLWPGEVLDQLYPAMDGRKTIHLTSHEGETITAADGFLVVGAYNPETRNGPLPEALASRFLMHIEVDTDLEMARTLGVPAKLIDAVKTMRTMCEQGEAAWVPQMREMLAFAKVAKQFTLTFAAENIIGVCPEDDRLAFSEVLSKKYNNAQGHLKTTS